MLKDLSSRLLGERHINIKLMEHFPNKTNKQISDARRRWRVNDLPPAPGIQEEMLALRHSEIIASAEPTAELPAAEINDYTWRESLKTETQKPYEVPKRWEASINKLYNITEPPVAHNVIEEVYGEIVKELLNKGTANENGANKVSRDNKKYARKRPKARPPNRQHKKKYAFAKCQELMNKCPAKLADAVVANDLSLLQIRQPPRTADTKALYTNLWGTHGPEQESPRHTAPTITISDILKPVTPEELSNKIKRITRTLAAGVDGIVKTDLKSRGINVVLSKLFNILFLHQAYPEAWKINRTTLIHKSAKGIGDVKNWRPITISSMLNRIFSSLLDRRIRNVIKQSERQKGFTNEMVALQTQGS